MPATIFSGNNVKALKSNLDLNGVTSILSVNAAPSSGAGVAAPLGSIAMDYLAGKVYKKTGSLATEWQEIGSGVGGINYISNPDAESGTTGWATYADAAGTAPVDGTGGSANITWTRSTTTPLRGIADFNLTKDAVNRQGQGVSTDFTINLADQAKVLTVTFDYEVLSGTYAAGDVSVYLIQDPSGTPVVIQPAGYQVQAATVGTKMRQIATFQTSSSATSYRLCLHVASTSASAYTLAIDNVSVGPQVVQYGAPVTDWQSYTFTIGSTGTAPTFGTTTVNTARWRRVGDSVELHWSLKQTSAGSAGTGFYLFPLPSGLSIDTSKLAVPSGLDNYATVGQIGITTSTTGYTGPLYAYDASRLAAVLIADGSGAGGNTWGATTAALSQTVMSASFFARIPILGWSSSVQMSNDTDTRVVAASATRSTTQALTANVTDVVMTTSVFDTHAAYNTTTGAYVAPVAGYYSINGVLSITVANSCTFVAYVDAASRVTLGSISNSVGFPLSGVVYLNAGQSLTIRADTTVTIQNARNAISIQRISGPSAIAASETVAASYWLPANQSAGTATPINFSSSQFDTHGAVTVGAAWKFTAPISGKYSISTFAYASGTATLVSIYKNGTLYVSLANPSTTSDGTGTAVIQLLAGEYVDLRPSATVTFVGGVFSGNDVAKIYIHRIGN